VTWRTPKEGDTRTRRIFALTPRVCDDGYTRWLCFVWVVEVLTSNWGDIDWQQKWAGPQRPVD